MRKQLSNESSCGEEKKSEKWIEHRPNKQINKQTDIEYHVAGFLEIWRYKQG